MKQLENLLKLGNCENRVAVVGSMNADLTVRTPRIPNPGETVTGTPLQILPGGKSANQAVCAAKLGSQVSMIGALGNDANRGVLEASFKAVGINTDYVQIKNTATGTAVITVDDQAENTIVVSPGANGLVDEDLVESAKNTIVQSGALGLCLEIPFKTVRYAAQIAHEAKVPVVFNLSPILPIESDFLKLVDVLIVNEHELAQILVLGDPDDLPIVEQATTDVTDTNAWKEIRHCLRKLGVSSAIVTLGSKGSVVLPNLAEENIDNPIIPIAPCPVEAVDTTGCGDSYMAAILTTVASGWDLESGAQIATLVSAYAAHREGAQKSYGTVTEIVDYFKQSAKSEN